MAYGRGFQRGNSYGNNQRRGNFSRSGGNRQGGTFEHKEGKGRAFGNVERDERGPFAGGSFKGLDGQTYRISLFLNVPAAEFNDQGRQADASELSTEIANMIKDAGFTIGISVQDMDAGNGRAQQSRPQQQQARPQQNTGRGYQPRNTPIDDRDEPPQQDDDVDTAHTEDQQPPWTADDAEPEPEPSRRTRTAKTTQAPAAKPAPAAKSTAAKPRTRK